MWKNSWSTETSPLGQSIPLYQNFCYMRKLCLSRKSFLHLTKASLPGQNFSHLVEAFSAWPELPPHSQAFAKQGSFFLHLAETSSTWSKLPPFIWRLTATNTHCSSSSKVSANSAECGGLFKIIMSIIGKLKVWVNNWFKYCANNVLAQCGSSKSYSINPFSHVWDNTYKKYLAEIKCLS